MYLLLSKKFCFGWNHLLAGVRYIWNPGRIHIINKNFCKEVVSNLNYSFRFFFLIKMYNCWFSSFLFVSGWTCGWSCWSSQRSCFLQDPANRGLKKSVSWNKRILCVYSIYIRYIRIKKIINIMELTHLCFKLSKLLQFPFIIIKFRKW